MFPLRLLGPIIRGVCWCLRAARWTQVDTFRLPALGMAALAMWFFAPPIVAQNVSAEKYGDLCFVPYADPITEEDLSFVVAEDLSGTFVRTGGLMWGCEGDRFTVILEPDVTLFAGEQYVTVQWRFDMRPLRHAPWSFGPDRLTLIAPTPVVPRFLRSSRTSAQLTMLIIDESATQYSFNFSLLGFTAASARLACLQSGRRQIHDTHRPRAQLGRPLVLSSNWPFRKSHAHRNDQ